MTCVLPQSKDFGGVCGVLYDSLELLNGDAGNDFGETECLVIDKIAQHLEH